MNIKHGASRRTAAALITVVAGLALAACGSSSGSGIKSGGAHASTTKAASSLAAQRSKLQACLKQHGVTLPSRPGRFAPGSGPGSPPGAHGGAAGRGRSRGFFFFGGGGGGARGNSKFRAAFQACSADFPKRFRGGPRFRRPGFSSATLAAFVACVKRHGYTLPKPKTAGNGPIFPRSIEANKKFQAAAKSCAGLLRPNPPPSGTTTSSGA